MDGNPENLRTRLLGGGPYLHQRTTCYYVLDYLRYGTPGNPDFILTLKNTYDNKYIRELRAAKEIAKDLIVRWTPEVMRQAGLNACSMVCVPRAKAFDSYTRNQMFLLEAVSEAAQALRDSGVTDAADAIRRHTDTRTTHLREETTRVTADGTEAPNTGRSPYIGITAATCHIDSARIRGNNILLVDDIYTGGVNVDEDCIQALYNAGAARVVLFTLSCTVPRG